MRFLTRFFPALLLLAALTASCTDRPVVNLALRHPAYHSSSIDYNVTAQLAVDGIEENEPARWVEVCGKDGEPLSKREHDLVFDPRQWTSVTVEGPSAELSVRTHGFTEPVDRVSMTLAARLPENCKSAAYEAELDLLEKDGAWVTVRRFEGRYAGGRLTLPWDAPRRTAPEGWRFRIQIPEAQAIEWQEWGFFRDGERLSMLTSEHFHSAWVPATTGPEWLAVDLGASQQVREVRLHWLHTPARGEIQMGDDTTGWYSVAEFTGDGGPRRDIFRLRTRGRWIRVHIDAAADGKPCALTEMQVLGRGQAPVPAQTGWEVARLPQADDPSAWIPATVPGTVLVSYLDNGMLPDPDFGDNQQYISDSYFRSPFVYRHRFALSEDWRPRTPDERTWLHFDGINWKADVKLNGSDVGRIQGAFTDAAFDITPLLQEDNLLEVTVYPPDHPGMTKENTLACCAINGGVLGADNPTFHASVGWDWIPTIRGRNMGIWNDVRLERTGPVRILDPQVSLAFNTRETLPPQIDSTQVQVTLSATLSNDTGHPVETVWKGSYGEVPFSIPLTLSANETLTVSTRFYLENPKFWWPVGYGEPHLYEVVMQAGDSHAVRFQSGIRHLTYDASGGNLRIWINGRRLVGRGGNWGFSESNLRYRAADYETAMRLHRHENFNLVRNWVGQVGDEEFYEAADRNGILVWQDFWLANPADGPDPDDEELFMANAENLVRRIRNHPCLLLWCGRNEGYPPQSLDASLRTLVAREDPGSYYISSSADDVVSGRGPYNRLPAKDYWKLDEIPWYRNESVQFHSERGMPNYPNWESLVEKMPENRAWPPSHLWGIHDFALESAQKGQTFIDAVDDCFGASRDAKTFAARAQWINYEGYRAMFESRSRNRRGLLLWMSHPAWPSMAFCTYDWFLDCTAAYYACRKACEPLHIQWNPVAEHVEVVNYSAGNRSGLRAVATVRNLEGALVSAQTRTLDAPEDSTTPLFDVDRPGPICFLRLQLFDGESLVSHNDYVLPQHEDDLFALNDLSNIKVTLSVDSSKNTVTLANRSGDVPALMLHLVARRNDGSRILPTLWSDNYIHLMPGEERTLQYALPDGETGAKITLTGFNLVK